jgi:2-methylcitrate dehydratase PrpD
MGATEELAQFACELKVDSVPAEAFRWAKDAILDCIGVALAGTKEEAGQIATAYVKEAKGRPEAGVFAAGFKTSAADAALANGTLAHALDFDDYTLPNWMGHPTSPLLPAILALGQRKKISGKEMLLAYVIGYEVGGRIGGGVGRGHYECGWHATATLGTMGATAAGARILQLDPARARMALGIASSEASGVRQNFGTMTKPLHVGLASRNGVLAASLAEKGFTADGCTVEGPLGFAKVLTAPGGYDFGRMTDGLFKSFLIVEHGISIKPYPCCADGHRCIDAILYLIEKHDIKPANVAAVECRISDMVPKIMIRQRPQTGAEGKFSLPFCMAIALIDRKVGLQQFTTERVLDPQVQELITRVSFVHPPEASGYAGMERYPEQVTVRLCDGTVYTHEVAESKGRPANRLSEAELTGKYRECAGGVLPPKRIDQSLEMLHSLEKVEDINKLMQVLCGGRGAK